MTNAFSTSTNATLLFVQMKDYRPIVLETLGLSMPGLRVLRLCLNRHLKTVDALEVHTHRYAQILCYLSGRGVLTVAGEPTPIRGGSIAYLPPDTQHGFREGVGRRPLCLVIDLEQAISSAFKLGALNAAESGAIRRELSMIGQQRDPSGESARLLVAAGALRILDTMFQALGLVPKAARAVPSFVRKFRKLAGDFSRQDVSIRQLALEVGYQPDYLNRIYRQETGLTLREQRDLLRLEQATRHLRTGASVQEAAVAVGIFDQNYFARWFKRHTGLPPSKYANG